MKPVVSVCVPVFGTEKYLLKCLESIARQIELPPLEIVVVNDGSAGTDDDGNDCKKIVKQFSKSVRKIRVEYIVHEKNKGLAEARRTAVEAASGQYVCHVDSDDALPPCAVSKLYEAAVRTGTDIIHGALDVFTVGEIIGERAEKRREEFLRRATKVFCGTLRGQEILDGYLIDKNHNGFICGKLFKRELYLDALSHVPPIFCTMAEDVLQYFWLSLLADSYFGFGDTVYNYTIDTGITSDNIVTTLSAWERVCSVSSVFTAIFEEIKTLPPNTLTREQDAAIRSMCRYYLLSNLDQWEHAVATEIKDEAYEILCDYWGKSFVEKMRQDIEKFKSSR